MTWRRSAGRFDLLGNRDELRTRPRAERPVVGEREGMRWIAPRDPEGGGTWIAVNERGLALTLLNGAEEGESVAAPLSRGLLVAELAASESAAAVASRLTSRDLSPWRPFGLLALDPAGGTLVATWEGGQLRLDPAPRPPLVSSSFRPPAVRGSRERLWAETVPVDGELDPFLDFHRSHLPERGATSPCMHRPDARTVSFSWITVSWDPVSGNPGFGPEVAASSGEGEAIFRYADGPPCRTRVSEAGRLVVRPSP